MIAYQILRPFSYLAIRTPGKIWIDVGFPLLATVVCILPLELLNLRIQIFMLNGLLSQLGSMIQNLPGFYIAALAALVAFDRQALDVLMPSPTPTVRTRIQGQWIDVELTRRKMLTLLFGYLAAFAILVYVAICFANAYAGPIAAALSGLPYVLARQVAVVLFFFSVWHLISVTFFGLYQISERIFRD